MIYVLSQMLFAGDFLMQLLWLSFLSVCVCVCFLWFIFILSTLSTQNIVIDVTDAAVTVAAVTLVAITLQCMLIYEYLKFYLFVFSLF